MFLECLVTLTQKSEIMTDKELAIINNNELPLKVVKKKILISTLKANNDLVKT
jgi:hypothetical protein